MVFRCVIQNIGVKEQISVTQYHMLEDEVSEFKNMFSGKENSAQNKNIHVAKYLIQ